MPFSENPKPKEKEHNMKTTCCECNLVASNTTAGKHYCDFCEPSNRATFAKALADEELGTSSQYDY